MECILIYLINISVYSFACTIEKTMVDPKDMLYLSSLMSVESCSANNSEMNQITSAGFIENILLLLLYLRDGCGILWFYHMVYGIFIESN